MAVKAGYLDCRAAKEFLVSPNALLERHPAAAHMLDVRINAERIVEPCRLAVMTSQAVYH